MEAKKESLIIKFIGIFLFLAGFILHGFFNETFILPYISGLGCTLAMFSKEISGYAFVGVSEHE
jgi:hypothetical protein